MLSHHQREARSLILARFEESRGLLGKLAFLYAPGNIQRLNAQAVRVASSPAFTRKLNTGGNSDAPHRHA